MADNSGGDRPSSDTIIPSKSSTSDEQKNISVSASTNKASEQQPRAKINISLKKKKKKKSKSTNNNNSQQLLNNNTNTLLAEEYSTIAEEAENISKRRKEEGDILVIPCKQQKDEDANATSSSKDTKKKQPLLARRLALLRQGDNNGVDNSTKEDNTKEDEDEAVKLLIQSAEQKDGNEIFDTNDKAAATLHGRGLVIAAPSENKLTTRSTDANNVTQMNDEQVFQHELAHHAADVDPTSNVYANVSIGDFGSALLRGMGWTGGGGSSSTSNNKSSSGNSKEKEEQVKPRPHRLGLGAKPVPLPSSSTSSKPSSSGGIHRRARRPEDVKRDEERLKQQEEEEKRIIEKKKLDVQYTLQNGSIVTHRDMNDNSSSQHDRRALIVQTAGVPGLNRILIQFEGESKEASVTKGSVTLCSWDELKQHPFKKIPLVREKKKEFKSDKRENGNGARKRDRSYSDDDDSRHDDERQKSDEKRRRERSRRYSDDESDSNDSYRRRSKKHKRKKRDRRSRSRSDSRERTGSKRRKESRKDKRRDRSRSPEDYHSSRKRSKHSSSDQHDSHSTHNSASTHWLIPNIRVRLISKKIPKYYLQKGIVQDVMKSSNSTSSSGPKAVLQMDNNGQVIDKVPERYLETALPKTGGMVIILESKDKTHHWKKGRLLEKSSKDGYGIVQLEEDLEVVKISLDGLAEWCGRMDD